MTRRATRIAAERVIPAMPADVYAFLVDLENHWLLADRFVDVLTIERPPGGGPATGGTVKIRGPLGVGRTAHTRVVEATLGESIAGTASVGPRTEARVHWTLVPAVEGTRVRLEATVVRATPVDAIVLAVGGRRWLEHRFGAILGTLARRLPPRHVQDSPA